DLRVSLLIDDNLEKLIRDRLQVSEGRIRQLLPVLPYGMDRSLVVSELIPPINEYPLLQDQHLRDFETGLQYFQQGDWEAAWRYLHSMPADDRAQDFLSMLITKHDRRPPPDWDGIVRMKKKS
ncbi:MAG: adenylate/guanylate cyclase domain-containing protein, partial [Planctomycetaceae bacterium]